MDGYGDSGAPGDYTCAPQPGWVTNNADCDDSTAAISPDATEVPCDGIDNDCTLATEDEPDGDGDGYSVCVDCDDSDATTYPGATEACDFLDNDCDGLVDNDCMEEPGGYYFQADFAATGGLGPGTVSAEIEWVMLEDVYNYVELCSYSYEFIGAYPVVAAGHGADYYPFIDLVVEYSSGTNTYSDCPSDWDDVYGVVTDVLLYFEWFMDPTAVITCDLVDLVPVLAATQLMDDFIGAGLTDGTLGSWCDEYGSLVAASGYTLEGVWVRPMDSAAGGYGIDLEYYPAINGDVGGLGLYDAWGFFGFVYGDTTNTYEPAPGLEGDYVSDIFWVWTI